MINSFVRKTNLHTFSNFRYHSWCSVENCWLWFNSSHTIVFCPHCHWISVGINVRAIETSIPTDNYCITNNFTTATHELYRVFQWAFSSLKRLPMHPTTAPNFIRWYKGIDMYRTRFDWIKLYEIKSQITNLYINIYNYLCYSARHYLTLYIELQIHYLKT